MVDRHTIRAFDADLRAIEGMIAEMGRLDDGQIAAAIDALVKRDVALARHVIASDDQIDKLQRELEEKAIATIARRQPMAVDLREITGTLRISNELERVGDLAKNIAKRVLLLNHRTDISGAMVQIQHMGRFVREQLRCVLTSYAGRDVAEALKVWRRDEKVDALNASLFRQLLTYMMEDPRNITFCTHLIFCAKNIERIGDHATNIAETIYYIVEGRQLMAERPKADLTSEETLRLRN